jgi:hypothetical protein
MEEHNKTDIEYLKSLTWTYQTWKPTAALIDKNGFASHQYFGQKFDQDYLTIDPTGWTHDHCEICWKTFCANSLECETSGFASNNLWICPTCYTTLFVEDKSK